MAMARAQMDAVRKRRSKKAVKQSQRLALGDQLLQQGDIRGASVVFSRLAIARPKSNTTRTARRRGAQLGAEARTKLADLTAKLDDKRADEVDANAKGPKGYLQHQQAWKETVITVFEELEQLEHNYDRVPGAKDMRRQIIRLRRQPEYSAIIYEPKAKAVWQLGQQHEADGELCCAYFVYQKAVRLGAAPSAQRALARFEELKQDPEVVAATKQCIELRWCHRHYNVAQHIIKTNPKRAQQMLAEILQRAPRNTDIHRAAGDLLKDSRA